MSSKKPKQNVRANPLAKWLKAHEVTQEEFVEIMFNESGWVCGQSTIAGWASGDRTPSGAAKYLVSKVTKDEVSVLSWDRWKRSATQS